MATRKRDSSQKALNLQPVVDVDSVNVSDL